MIATIIVLLTALPLAWGHGSQVPYKRKPTECTVKSIRKSWFVIYVNHKSSCGTDDEYRADLTTTEKQSYLDADLCLMELPPKDGIKGATSRWDELQYAHAAQARYIHFTVRLGLAVAVVF
jgi:tyrosinase